MADKNIFDFRTSPKRIEALLEKTVIGQKEAKKAISVTGFLHILRIANVEHQLNDFPLKKQNILLMGPTGCGKTLLVSTLAKELGVPFYEIHAKDISQQGWKGNSLEDHLLRHKESLHYEKEKQWMFPYSIIFIDEFDKICKPTISSTGTDWSKETQGSILKAVEGCVVHAGESVKTGSEIDTTNMWFIFSGNFEDLRKDRANIKKSIGFFDDKSKATAKKDLHEELIKYGVIPELAGRISQVVELETLTKKQLKSALLDSDRSIYQTYKGYYRILGKELVLTKAEISRIITKCFKSKIGARGLDMAVDELLRKDIYKEDYSI